MKKIPVGATIAHAYRFAFGQFPGLLKLLWLPMAISVAISIVTTPQTLILTQGLRTHNYSGLWMPVPLIALLVLVAWIFGFVAITGAFQFALDKDGVRGRWLYLSFAMPLWRLIGAFLLLIVVMSLLLLVYILAITVILFLFRIGLAAAHVSDTALKGILALDGALAFLVGYCAFVFCWLRFGFLLGASTVAEGRIGLFRSWALSHRNFWRMFAVTLAIFLPLMAIEIGGLYQMGAFPHIQPGATPADIQAAQNAASAVMMAKLQRYGMVIYPLFILITPIIYGLMAGASAFAYRALAEEERPIS